jgi:hypothetical protein
MIAKEKNGPVSLRKRLMYEATADCFAILLYERAGMDYPEYLDGLGGDFMQRVSDMRTMAEFHMIMNSANTEGTKQYFNHPFIDSFRKIVSDITTDGTLEEMNVEDMLLMARDHVENIGNTVITDDYVATVTTSIIQDRPELYALAFTDQADLIRKRLDEGKYDGVTREFYQRYLRAVDRTLASPPLTKEAKMAEWEARLLHDDEHEVDFEKARALEIELLQRQIGSLYSKVKWARDHQGHEAAKVLFDRFMHGKEGSEELGLADRLVRLSELNAEHESKLKIRHEELQTAPARIVSMDTIEAIRLQADQVLGDHKGKVAVIDTAELFSVNETGGLKFDPHNASPELLLQLKDQMTEDQTDKVPSVLGSLKQGMGKYFTQKLNADNMVQTIFWQDPNPEEGEDADSYALVCIMPNIMSAHQIEQRMTLSNDPEAVFVSPLETKTLQMFLATRELANLRAIFDADLDEEAQSDLVKRIGSPKYIHEWLYRNATLDCYALLASYKAHAQNPEATEHPEALAERMADLRDFALMNSMLSGGSETVFSDTGPFIRAAEGFILHGYTQEELREKSMDELAEKMVAFIDTQIQDAPPVVVNKAHQEVAGILRTQLSFLRDPSIGFLERRDILTTLAMPSVNDSGLSKYSIDLLRRMRAAAWNVVENNAPATMRALWEKEMTSDSDLTREERLLKILFEADWIQEQQSRTTKAIAAAGEVKNPFVVASVEEDPSIPVPPSINDDEESEEPAEATAENEERKIRPSALPAADRLRALSGLAQQLQADSIEYSAAEARHILQTYLKEIMLKAQGRFVKVKIDPDMIGPSGFDITIPPGSIPGIDVPVSVIVTPEYVASLDPDFGKKQQEAAKDKESRLIRLPLPSGKMINIVVTSDMISDDGSFITLQPDQIPAELGPSDEPMKIFVPKQILEEAKKLAAAEKAKEDGTTPDSTGGEDVADKEKDDQDLDSDSGDSDGKAQPADKDSDASDAEKDKDDNTAKPPSANDDRPTTMPKKRPKASTDDKDDIPVPPPIKFSLGL